MPLHMEWGCQEGKRAVWVMWLPCGLTGPHVPSPFHLIPPGRGPCVSPRNTDRDVGSDECLTWQLGVLYQVEEPGDIPRWPAPCCALSIPPHSLRGGGFCCLQEPARLLGGTERLSDLPKAAQSAGAGLGWTHGVWPGSSLLTSLHLPLPDAVARAGVGLCSQVLPLDVWRICGASAEGLC